MFGGEEAGTRDKQSLSSEGSRVSRHFEQEVWKTADSKTESNNLKKMWYIYAMEYYSAMKKNEAMSFAATRIDLGMIQSEVKHRKTNTTWYLEKEMAAHSSILAWKTP